MMKFRCLLNLFCVKQQFYRPFSFSSNINPNEKYVLINGCDTIFAHSLARQLDKQGFHIFAGVYDLKSKFILKNQLSKRATIFPIDITRSEDINNTFNLVKKETNTLHALINNVDVSSIHRLERNTMEMMCKKMNLYFFGHVSMIKIFVPLLITKQNSQIVNICTDNHVLDLSLEATYVSMKHALTLFSDSLRCDMALWNLHVNIIETTSIYTDKYRGKIWNKLSMDVRDRWDKDFLKIQV